MSPSRHLAILVLATLASGATPVQALEYAVDPSASSFVVKTRKGGPAAQFAHNHVIAAKNLTGVVHFDESGGAPASVALEVDTRTLVVDDPALRGRFGETSVLSAADRAKVRAHMEDSDQLDVARHAKMVFRSTSVTPEKDKRYRVVGELTIRGVTRQVSFPAVVENSDGVFRSRGELVFKQTSFGWKPFSTMLGAVRNQDEVTLFMDVVAKPRVASEDSVTVR